MNFAAALFAPFLLLISAASADEEDPDRAVAAEAPANVFPRNEMPSDTPEWDWGIVRSFVPDSAEQVHIEQRTTIRITPRSATPPRVSRPRFSERKIGKCLPMSAIAGVEPSGPSSLVLFMRDRRMIAAELDHSCLARSFYSGFYLSRSTDGNVCVNRDTLLSRSGTACKLSRIRELVERPD